MLGQRGCQYQGCFYDVLEEGCQYQQWFYDVLGKRGC